MLDDVPKDLKGKEKQCRHSRDEIMSSTSDNTKYVEAILLKRWVRQQKVQMMGVVTLRT